jgi:hypothetical protein
MAVAGQTQLTVVKRPDDESGRAYRSRLRPGRSCSYPHTAPAVADYRSRCQHRTCSAALHTVPTGRPGAGHGHMADGKTRIIDFGRGLRRQAACIAYRTIGL